MDEHQERFLKDEFLGLTLAATVQRANVYRRDTCEEDKIRFRKALRACLQEIASAYHTRVCEEDHVNNIVRLSSRLSANHEDCLVDDGFRIGLAQKALNLHLKYRWCMGEIPTPPHCPFDSQVIAELPDCRGIRWTQIIKPAEYRRLVEAAKAQAQDVPLAVWELLLYNRARHQWT